MLRKLILVILFVAVVFTGYEWLTFPDVSSLATSPPQTTAFMELRKAELRSEGKSDAIEYHWVPYGSISPYLRRAALVAEDDSFYEHDAVDVKGLKEAAASDWKKKKFAAGGSTITQQLAKNLYLSPSRNPLRKLKEFLIARSLERHLTKKRILELYLNVVEMGERTYGADAAAHHYFRKPAAELSPSEAALLAGCLPNPRVMDPASPNRRLRSRQRMILSRMRRWGYLYEEEVLTERKPDAGGRVQPATNPPTDSDLTPPPALETTTEAPTESTPADSGTAAPGTTTDAEPSTTTTESSP